jgi:hypothetical protein
MGIMRSMVCSMLGTTTPSTCTAKRCMVMERYHVSIHQYGDTEDVEVRPTR